MAFSRDGRFRDNENRLQETIYAQDPCKPTPTHYQHVHTKGLIERSSLISPNKMSSCGTTFGCSDRPVLMDANYTCQGKISGAFKHRSLSSQSPRPGPGAHLQATKDNFGATLWRTQKSITEQDGATIKAMINSLNLRINDEELNLFEGTSKDSLRKRRNYLCSQLRQSRSNPDLGSDGLSRVTTTRSRGGTWQNMSYGGATSTIASNNYEFDFGTGISSAGTVCSPLNGRWSTSPVFFHRPNERQLHSQQQQQQQQRSGSPVRMMNSGQRPIPLVEHRTFRPGASGRTHMVTTCPSSTLRQRPSTSHV